MLQLVSRPIFHIYSILLVEAMGTSGARPVVLWHVDGLGTSDTPRSILLFLGENSPSWDQNSNSKQYSATAPHHQAHPTPS